MKDLTENEITFASYNQPIVDAYGTINALVFDDNADVLVIEITAQGRLKLLKNFGCEYD